MKFSQSAQPLFVMIGGTTRAGTTSLYKYLSDHREVGASSQKETRFFLDPDYPSPHPITFRYDRDSIEKYLGYFTERGRPVYLEATPDYLYSPGTPKRVHEQLKDVKWIFILRDPIERLVSWFHFGRQKGELEANISMDDFINCQLDQSMPHPKQVFRTLQQGKYSHYLQPFYDLFGRENVLLLSFGTLERTPFDLMQKVCHFIGIDESFYRDYVFSQLNASMPLKKTGRFEKLYSRYAAQLYLRVYNRSLIRKILHVFRVQLVEPLYYHFKADKNGQTGIPLELREQLDKYYAGELERLEALSGEKFSWK